MRGSTEYNEANELYRVDNFEVEKKYEKRNKYKIG